MYIKYKISPDTCVYFKLLCTCHAALIIQKLMLYKLMGRYSSLNGLIPIEVITLFESLKNKKKKTSIYLYTYVMEKI